MQNHISPELQFSSMFTTVDDYSEKNEIFRGFNQNYTLHESDELKESHENCDSNASNARPETDLRTAKIKWT